VVAALTRVLHANGYGQYAALVSFTTILQIIADFGLYLTFTKAIGRSPDLTAPLLQKITRLRLILLGGTFLLGAVLVPFVIQGPSNHWLAYVVLALGLTFQSLSQLRMGLFQAHGTLWRATIGDLAGRGIQILSILLAARYISSHPQSDPLTFMIAAFTAGTLTSLVIHQALTPKLQTAAALSESYSWGQIMKDSWPLAAILILNVIYFRVDMVMLAILRPQVEVGWYGLAYRLIESVLFFPAMLGGILLPRLSKAGSQGQSRLLKQSLSLASIGGMGLGLIFFLYPAAITTLISGPDYAPAGPLLRILSFTIPIMFVGNIIGFGLVAAHKQKAMLYLSIGLVLGNSLGNILLIPRLGPTGAAITTLLTEIASMTIAAGILHGIHPVMPSRTQLTRTLGIAVITILVALTLRSTPVPALIKVGLTSLSYLAACYLTGALNKAGFSELLRQKNPIARPAL